MRRARITGWSLLIFLGLACNGYCTHWTVYLFTGQSNMLGTTADPTESDISLGNHPADDEIRFFWSNRSTRNGDGAAAIIGDSAGQWETLKAQQGEGRNTSFWGPEVAFGRHLHAKGHRHIAIIKAARGGGGNSYWRKDEQMYRHVCATVQAATDQLVINGDTFTIDHLLYLQGESDKANEAMAAGKRLNELLTHLRKDLPHATSMRLVIGGIAAGGGTRDQVRKQQAQIASLQSTITYFDNTDLQNRLYDGLHFDKLAKLRLGERFADAVLDDTGTPIRIACIGDSITYGYGIPNSEMMSYPARLQHLLGDRFSVRNLGDNGRGIVQKSMRGTTRRAYIFQDEHADALVWEPDIVICNLGINDVMDWDRFGKTDFAADYKALIQAYQALPVPPRILIWHPLAPLFPGQKYFGDPNVNAINEAIEQVARDLKIETIDLQQPLIDHPKWFPDFIHPNTQGAACIAETVHLALGLRIPSPDWN
ncbi:MAG: lysophospholipase L1-like esterase [Kiritimatiellia bacterium]|jgi:lysophospholipase L1-like esterase